MKGQMESTVSSASDAPLEPESRSTTEHLQGIVERLTYHNEHSGYTVARLKVTSEKDLVTIVGHFPSITAGQTLRLTGFWRDHPKYGQQFAQETKPATLTGLEKYLGSGLIKGVGPVTAKRIVAHFGLDTLDYQHCSGRPPKSAHLGKCHLASQADWIDPFSVSYNWGRFRHESFQTCRAHLCALSASSLHRNEHTS